MSTRNKDITWLFWILVWTIGLIGGLIFSFLRLIRVVEVSGFENLKKVIASGQKFVIIHRHPSLREPALLPFLFFPRFLFNLKYVPISTPKIDYYRKFWFFLFRLFSQPIHRGNPKEAMKALRQIGQELIEGMIFILAPGGGREYKGKEFKIIKDGQIQIAYISSVKEYDREAYNNLSREVNGRIIRRFKPGIGSLIQTTGCSVLPIWVEVGRIQIRMVIGEPLRFFEGPLRTLSRKEIARERREIIDKAEDSLLLLGDKK